MKPIRRLAFNLLAGVSALLCLATGAMWVRSYFAADFWIREKSADVRESIESSEGVIGWWRNGFPPGVFGPANYTTHWSQLPNPIVVSNRFMGFGWDEYVSTLSYWAILIPYWSLFLVTTLLPLARLRTWRRERHPAQWRVGV